jgi:shikimate dehydrogenase
MALRREWPETAITILGRRPEEVARLAGFCGATSRSAGGVQPTVVVNTTTYGETDESEEVPFGLDLETLFDAGTGYFDLNNRVGTLSRLALARGCKVMTGTFMQLTTDAIRASLARGALKETKP